MTPKLLAYHLVLLRDIELSVAVFVSELPVHALPKEEMDAFIQSASASFMGDLISNNSIDAKFEWFLKITDGSTCLSTAVAKPFLALDNEELKGVCRQGHCFQVLLKFSTLSVHFKERLVEWIGESLAKFGMENCRKALFCLSCCAEILKDAGAFDRHNKQQLSTFMTAFITRLSILLATVESKEVEVLLKHALFVYGLVLHKTGGWHQDQSFYRATAQLLLSTNHEVTSSLLAE